MDSNLTISGNTASSLAGATFGGNLQIQQLSAGQPQSALCGSVINSNLTVQYTNLADKLSAAEGN